jgi:hypothetical protein
MMDRLAKERANGKGAMDEPVSEGQASKRERER